MKQFYANRPALGHSHHTFSVRVNLVERTLLHFASHQRRWHLASLPAVT